MISFSNIFEFMSLQQFSLIASSIILFNILIISFFSLKNNNSKPIKKYNAEQRVHTGEIPRLGGSAIYIWLFVILIIFEEFSITGHELSKYIYLLLLCFPLMLVSFIEDLLSNISVKIRFITMVITAFFVCSFFITSFPDISNIPIISYFFQYKSFSVLFFSLCLIALMNGSNFIDGMNGLLSFYLLGVMLSCINLSIATGNVSDSYIIVLLLIGLLCFILFNYPFGLFFLGDSGAYFLSLILGVWVIIFFANNSYISSWNACIIFFYPIAEVFYSVIRKLSQKKSPFYPDRFHVHIKIYHLLNKSIINKKICNGLTTIFLSFLWLMPPLALPLVMHSQIAIFLKLILLSAIYLSLNVFINEEK